MKFLPSGRHPLNIYTGPRALAAGLLIYTALWFVLIYSDIIHHSFLHWDDIIYIVNNPYLQDLTINNFIWMLTDYQMVNWHPLTWFSHAIDFTLFGNNPVLFKVNNIALHLTNSVLLFFIFRIVLKLPGGNNQNSKLTLDTQQTKIIALAASCMFAIHPQHIESVVWIAERKDVLCALFYFSTILSYLKYRLTNQIGYYYAMIAFAVLATMAKPMAVSIPFSLIVFDIFVIKQLSSAKTLNEKIKVLLKDKIILIFISIFIAIITLYTQSATIKDLDSLSLFSRAVTACIAILHYLFSIIYPANLSPFYPFSDAALTPKITSMFPIAGFVIVIGLCITLSKKGFPIILAALAFYLITLLPVAGIIAVGNQAYADRYSYIPTSFIYLAITYFIFFFLNKINNYKLKIYSATAVTIFSISSIGFFSNIQIQNWRNDNTLWSAVIAQYPNQVYLAHQNLGNSYLNSGLYTQAITQYEIALSLDSTAAKTHENIGRAYGKLGIKQKEIEHYLLAIKHDNSRFWPHLFAGYFYLKQKNYNLASEHLVTAFNMAPGSPPVVVANAKLNLLQQNPVAAQALLRTLLDSHPDHREAIRLMVQVQYSLGNNENARILLERLLTLSPNDRNIKSLLAKLTRNNNQGQQQ